MRKAFLSLVSAVCLGGLVGAAPGAEAKARVFMAGAATSNITPWLGDGIVGGWNPPPAKHVHDELHARCLVLDDATNRLVIVLVDSVAVPREVFDEAKRLVNEHTGLTMNRMLMAATHTHSATSARWKNILVPNQEFFEYQKFLARRIADGVRRAINNLEPARIAWGSADVPGHVFNRRWLMKPGTPLPNPFGGQDQAKMNPGSLRAKLLKPAGPVDPQISFVSVQSAAGRPIALLANYSLHYVGGTTPATISADYFALFADRIQQLLGADRLDPPFVGIMSNGTSGDVNNNNYAAAGQKRAPFEKMRLVADQAAEAVAGRHAGLAWHDWVPLDMRQRELELAVRKPTPEQLKRAQELLARPEAPDALPHERAYAERVLQQHEAPPAIRVVVQALRIGDLGIATSPFETFAETGLEIKAASPLRPTFTISLANGGYGYLPTPPQHALGGYETWLGTSKVETQASVKLTAALLEMLGELKGK